MKKRLMAMICSAAILCSAAMPAWAESESTSENVSGEKAVVSSEANPNTGAMTLATVSVALAGCVVLIFKKRK